MAARAAAVEVIAARAGAFMIEVDADRPAAAALRTGRGLVGERRQVGLVDGGGRDGRAIYHGADRARDRSTWGDRTNSHAPTCMR